MQVDRQTHFLLERLDQLFGCIGLKQTGHILDGQDMRAALFEFLGHVDIVVECIFVALGIGDVARVADRRLRDLVGRSSLLKRDFHAGNPVERVKHAEHVNTAARSFLHESADEIIRVVRIANRIRAAQQHLERDVRNLAPQPLKPLPRILVQIAIGHIKGRAAPHFQRKGVGINLRHARCALDHVARTHAGRQQTLMRVAHRRVADHQLLLGKDEIAHRDRALFVQKLLQAIPALAPDSRETGGVIHLHARRRVIDHDVADVFEHLCCSVLGVLEFKELRRIINKAGVASALQKHRMRQDIAKEGHIGFHTAHAGLGQGTACLARSTLEADVIGRDLNEQTVIIRGDGRALIGVAAIQTNAVAAARAVCRDRAGVGREIVGGVLRRDTALDCIAALLHILLRCNADQRMAQREAAGNKDLRAHEIDTRDHLGDGVLDLNARVHLDEIMRAGLVDQELHSTCVDIADLLGNLDGVLAQPFTQLLGQRPCGRILNYLLVTALQRAVTLIQMHGVAFLVGQNLHLDVLGLNKVFFDKDGVVAKGLLRLGANQLKGRLNLLLRPAGAHTASAAAGGRLEDDRKTVAPRLFQRLLRSGERIRAAGNCGHTAGIGHLLGGELVAHFAKHIGGRSDKLNACRLAGFREIRILRQEAIARMDGVHVLTLGKRHDLVDGEVSAKRAERLADQIGLVRLGSVCAVNVLLGVDRHRCNAEVIAGAQHAGCDLAAVGDEDLLEFSRFHLCSPPRYIIHCCFSSSCAALSPSVPAKSSAAAWEKETFPLPRFFFFLCYYTSASRQMATGNPSFRPLRGRNFAFPAEKRLTASMQPP